MTIGDISGLIAVVISLIGVYIALRRAPFEFRKLGTAADASKADTAGKYQEIADRAAERALKLDEQVVQLQTISQKQGGEIRALRTENDQMRETINEQGCEIRGLRNDNTELRVWSARLTQQVIELNGIPVPMRIKIDQEDP